MPLKFVRQGIRYDELSEDEKDEWDSLEWSEDGDVPDMVGAEELNKWLFNADTVDKALSTLMTNGHRVAGGDRIGKTIIFAKNTDHAQFIAQRFDLAYPEHAGHLARVITYRTEYAQSLIDGFSVRDKAPHIAISVDMLDTGIDVPEIVNLVFFKLVRSKTKFWQMIGRGTRLCFDLYARGGDKKNFYVFDFCQNLEFFNQSGATSEGSLQKSLGQRLFEARLGLVTGLDLLAGDEDADAGPDPDGTKSEHGLRTNTAAHLHRLVQGMNLDNFVVRPERRWVEAYADWEPWRHLTREAASDVAEHLAALPSTLRDDDEQAKRFDLLVLRIQLAMLDGDHMLAERLRQQVQEIASALLSQTAIPSVAAQQQLLDEVAGDEWWIDVTLPMLELARRRIRGLVRFVEKSKRAIVYTDFADELGEGKVVNLTGISVGTNYERFLAKARAYLRDHEDHVTLQRLRRNKQLTPADLTALERMLLESGAGEEADIARAAEDAHGLGLFVRSLVGLDREAATEAFSEFLADTAFTVDQIRFVNLIVEHLTDNGVMEARRLYESPFTDHAPHGPDMIFPDDVLDGLILTLDSVRAHALPTATVA
ncbi:MAG: type I restriction-modification enzyme R subunit C-terminal domain-containing protein [Geodermatophilaceae bacterium]